MIDELLNRIELEEERIRDYRRRISQSSNYDYDYEDEHDGEEIKEKTKTELDIEWAKDVEFGTLDPEDFCWHDYEIPEEIYFNDKQEDIQGHHFYSSQKNEPRPVRYRVSPENPWYFDIDGVVFSKTTGLLTLFPPGKGKEYTIPDDKRITGIGYGAFAGNTLLEKITFNNQIQYIGLYAFRNCKGIKTIYLPSCIEHIDKAAFEDCTSLEKAEIDSRINKIPRRMFNGDTNLSVVRLPESVTAIEGCVFTGCTSLKDVKPKGQENMDYDIVIPALCSTIGEETFKDCNRITSVLFYGTTETIDKCAFAGCTSLIRINSELVSTYKYRCFQDCKSIEHFDFSKKTFRIGKEIFYGADNLKSIHIDCVSPFWCEGDALPENVDITINSDGYLRSLGPYDNKRLFFLCVSNVIKGEEISEEALKETLRILKRNRKKLYDWFIQDIKTLEWSLKADILDCDNCTYMMKLAERDDESKAEMIHSYMKQHFTTRKMKSSLAKWEIYDQEQKAIELKEQQLLEEQKRLKEELMNKARTGLNISLEEMDLSVRAYNCLKRAGIISIVELETMTIYDLMKVRNLGRKCTEEVIAKIEYFKNEGKALSEIEKDRVKEPTSLLKDFDIEDIPDPDLDTPL